MEQPKNADARGDFKNFTVKLSEKMFLFMYCEHILGFDDLRQIFGIFVEEIFKGPAD